MTDYESLLDRARDRIPKDISERSRWTMPEPDVLIEGSQTILRNFSIVSYVKSYVICSQCRAPDTSFIKEARTTLLKCQACGATRPVRL